jgi:class 3 adenylate cyclase
MKNIEEFLRERQKKLKELNQIDQEVRQLFSKPVTLLFTDIVGSTKYFERMGDIAGRQMIENHNNELFPIIEQHGGKIIKTIGDSIMATFEDPVESVRCAIEMQTALKAYNKNIHENQHIRVRMGLHYGEAVVDKKDLFGDMVNTAARVEARARGEEILISASLKEKVEDCDFPLVYLGSDFVKGKEQKIDFYAVNWNNISEQTLRKSWNDRFKAASIVQTPREIKQKVVIRKNIDLKEKQKEIKPLSIKGNPYLNRVMIPHPNMFFGRKSVVKRIMNRISAESPQSVSIVGERRIGKSSLLNFLNFPQTRLAYLDEPEQYLFLFIDFQQLRATEEKQIIGMIFAALKKQLGQEIELVCKENFDGLRFLCEQITEKGYKFILFFDEFESVTKNENIGPEFYSFFRSLANNYALAFVTASGRNLKDMCVSHQISDSPFFNIFAVHHLGLFREAEARELIEKPSEQWGIPLAPVADKILEQGGLYPFFLQMACSAWFEYLDSEDADAEDFVMKKTPREVLDMFREEAKPHFEYVFETFLEEEREVFRLIAGDKSLDSSSQYVEMLERKGYIIRNADDSFSCFSAEFDVFIKKQFR